jgi:hypothetical protein
MRRRRFIVDITTKNDDTPYKRLAYILENAIREAGGIPYFGPNIQREFYLANTTVLKTPNRPRKRLIEED